MKNFNLVIATLMCLGCSGKSSVSIDIETHGSNLVTLPVYSIDSGYYNDIYYSNGIARGNMPINAGEAVGYTMTVTEQFTLSSVDFGQVEVEYAELSVQGVFHVLTYNPDDNRWTLNSPLTVQTGDVIEVTGASARSQMIQVVEWTTPHPFFTNNERYSMYRNGPATAIHYANVRLTFSAFDEELADMNLAEIFIDADEGAGGGVSSFLDPQDIAIPTSIIYYIQFNFNFQRSSPIVPSGSSIIFPVE